MEQMRVSARKKAILEALIVTFLWSSSYILTKFGLVNIQPLTLVGLRYLVARARQNAGEYTGKMKEPLRSVNRRTPIIKLNTSGGILMRWLGLSLLLKEVSVISGHNWWPVFSAGIGVLLILRARVHQKRWIGIRTLHVSM